MNLVKEMDVGTIVVGLPTGLSGDEGTSASEARKLADELGSVTGIEVALVDERYTSRIAERSLLQTGMKRRERREKVDQVAAALILQDYLDKLK
jgi:putative Holliday junction resolvase